MRDHGSNVRGSGLTSRLSKKPKKENRSIKENGILKTDTVATGERDLPPGSRVGRRLRGWGRPVLTRKSRSPPKERQGPICWNESNLKVSDIVSQQEEQGIRIHKKKPVPWGKIRGPERR